LKALPEFSSQIAEGARVGLSLIVEQMPAFYRTAAIYMAISRFGYVGLVRTIDGRGNLAAAIDLIKMKSVSNPVQMVGSILEDAGWPSPTFSESDVWRGTIPLMRKTNRLTTHRVLLLGDAAGYAEPFTGEGIGWALSSAVAVTQVVVNNLDSWNAASIDEWQIAQKRQMLRGQIVCRALAYLLRRPTVVRLALGALKTVPALAQPLVRKVYQTKSDVGRHPT
jgi:flavin-dependent dehydrogenase